MVVQLAPRAEQKRQERKHGVNQPAFRNTHAPRVTAGHTAWVSRSVGIALACVRGGASLLFEWVERHLLEGRKMAPQAVGFASGAGRMAHRNTS
jgi:hypothetical protein